MAGNLHPSPTGSGRWERIGRTSRWKCAMCGFPRDANRGLAKGNEVLADGVISSGVFGTAAEDYEDDTFSFDYSGGCCPMCGTFRSGPMHRVAQSTQGKGFKKRNALPRVNYSKRMARF